jgi:hypothetical protein
MLLLSAHFLALSWSPHRFGLVRHYPQQLRFVSTPSLYLFILVRVFKAVTSVSVITQFNSCCQLTLRSNSTVNTTLHIALRWANEWSSSSDPCASHFEGVHVCFFWLSVSDWPSHACSLRNTYCIEPEISSPCFSSHIPVETELQMNQRCGFRRGL